MDLDLAVRDEVLARFVQYAPHIVMTGIASALDLPEPAFYDDADGQPIADEFDAYIDALSADVEARGIRLVQLLRAAMVAALPSSDLCSEASVTTKLKYAQLDWIGNWNGKKSFESSLSGRPFFSASMIVSAFPRTIGSEDRGEPNTRVAYNDYRQSPATATLVPTRHFRGVIGRLEEPLAWRYRRNRVAALYNALAASTALDGGIIDWVAIARWMQLVPTRTGAPYTLVAPGQRWSAEQVRSLFRLAEHQGVTAYLLFDACKAAGHLHLADLVVWHLTHHPAAYALVHGIKHQTAASAQNSAAEISSARLGSAEAVGLQDSESVAALADPTPDSCSRSLAEAAMAQLPMEMVVAVLRQPWALDDLIVCRRVCRRWRAAVAILATHDRRFAYSCGLHDWRSIQNLPGIPDPVLPITEMAVFSIPRPALVDMWCTCGRLLPNDVTAVMLDSATEADLARPPYADRHGDQRQPLARWAQLRPSRDLALALTQACAHIDPRVLDGPMLYIDGLTQYLQGQWLPLFLWLPDAVVRPRSTAELLALVRTLVDDVQDSSLALVSLWTRLSDPASACAWYGQRATTATPTLHSTTWEATWLQAQPPAAMPPTERARALQVQLDINLYDPPHREAFARDFPDYDIGERRHLQLADDPGGWQKNRFLARYTCLRWNHILERGLSLYGGVYGLNGVEMVRELNAAIANDIAVHLYDQVHAVDAAVSLFDEHCVLSCTYLSDGEYRGKPKNNFFGGFLPATFFIGLDARGHLVGAVTGTVVWN